PMTVLSKPDFTVSLHDSPRSADYRTTSREGGDDPEYHLHLARISFSLRRGGTERSVTAAE
ncbi:hypothetical protein, partial [Mycolicibacterium sp.]|uniref:hypothetical protein n=1 Tax=Mycolicibacterium sp. TaxID=2320850 RepID=UPI0037C7EEFB